MYKIVYFDISGICNASCPWCVTGNRNLAKKQAFIDVTIFEKAIFRMLEEELIDCQQTTISLYSWGEPLLHPQFPEIINILNKYKIYYGLSTNASAIDRFLQAEVSYLKGIIFSMSGFSQKSYDRIHGLNFDKVIQNIKNICQHIRQCGFTYKPYMAYHLYQFNIDEISEAKKFCEEQNLLFNPVYAFFNDYNLAKAYLEKKIEPEILYKASRELFLYYLSDLLAQQTTQYQCPQFDILTLDEQANIVTCCVLPSEHEASKIGSLFQLTKKEITERKCSQRECNYCIKSGISYWLHHPQKLNCINDL